MPQEIISWSGFKALSTDQVWLNVAQRRSSKRHWVWFMDPVSGECVLGSQPRIPKSIFCPAWSKVSHFPFFHAAFPMVLPTHLCFCAPSSSTFTYLCSTSLMSLVYQLFEKLLACQCSGLLIRKSWPVSCFQLTNNLLNSLWTSISFQWN